jgi:hypothetical protein
MTTEQYEHLRQLILDMKVQLSSLERRLQKAEEIATVRHQLIYQWCAPASYKAQVDAVAINIPDDLRKFFPAG